MGRNGAATRTSDIRQSGTARVLPILMAALERMPQATGASYSRPLTFGLPRPQF